MTTLTIIISVTIALYVGGFFALYIGHRMDHVPFHPSILDLFMLPLVNVFWFLIIGRLCHCTKSEIFGDDPYNQKQVQPKIDRLLLKCNDLFKE